MKDKKIVFFDIDGTIINVPNKMMDASKETRRIIKTFREQGNIVVIASARGALPQPLKNIEIDGFIGSDGHYIEYGNEILLEDIFTQEEVELQMKVFKENNAQYGFSGRNGSWISDLDAPIVVRQRELYAGTKERPKGLPENWESKDVVAISCTPLFENKEDLYNALSQLPNDWAIEAYDTGLIRMDVHKAGFSKGTACEYLYKKLGIPFENTYAFGDGSNDVEMFHLVNHSVAMGNASDEVKKEATYVTDTVDQDGIAKAFKKIFNV